MEDVGRLPGDVETALFRVVQESLTSISRHSGSSTAIIKLDRQEDQIVLQITDHGRGMSRIALSDADGSASMGVGIRGSDFDSSMGFSTSSPTSEEQW